MLRSILCLSHSNPGAAIAGLAAAAQAAVDNSNAILKRVYTRQSEPSASQTPINGGTRISSSTSSALHQLQQHDHCQQCAVADAANEQQHHRQHVNGKTCRNEPSSWGQQPSLNANTTAAAFARCRPHLLQQQQQRAFTSQPTAHICRSILQACHQQQQQQQQLLQGPAAFWLVGQAWRGMQHPNKPLPKGKRPAAQSKPKPEVKKPTMRRNKHITAPVLMVVMPDGTTQEMALAAALDAAASAALDLVEVNPRGQPPVARVMDWSKFAYEQQQKADAADKLRRQQQKLTTPKEMQFSARIADHDLEVKMRKVADWLDQGYRVQMVVKHGREEEAAAAEALDYLVARVQEDYNVEAGAQQQQRRAVSMLVKPLGAPGEAAKNKAVEADS